jgi:hypothetical protein
MEDARFAILPIPSDVVDTLRARLTDDAGNVLTPRSDGDRHQCRSCLTLTEPGEPYYAVSYAPMAGSHPFVERGPVYIHARACEPYREPARYPGEFPRSAVVLRAYNAAGEIEDARFVGQAEPEHVIEELFRNDAIRYLHARNSAYGCFMFRVERSPSQVQT